jgi:putative oligomerization/nucleic acid binding protein
MTDEPTIPDPADPADAATTDAAATDATLAEDTAQEEPTRRRGLAMTFIVVGTVIGFLAVFAIWVQRQALNTDNWTNSSSQLLENTAIRTAVSGYLVDQLYASVDVQGELRNALPRQFKGLAGPAAGGLRNVAGNVADEALQRPRVQALWEQANRQAHTQLLRVLKGGGSALQTNGGVVSLDLGALLSDISSRTGVGGRVAGKLPPGAARIVILRSNQLKAAQDVANAIKPLAIILTVLALALYALAIWLGHGWRREALRAAGVGFVIAGVLALVVRRFAGTQLVDSLATTDAIKPAVQAAWDIETSLLVNVASATIAYGIVAVLAAWLAGPTSWAVGLRRSLAPYLREPAYAWGGFAIVVLLLLVWAPTQALRQPLTALILIALLAFGFEVLRRQAEREFPVGERRIGLDLRAALGRVGSNGVRGRGSGSAATAASGDTAAAATVESPTVEAPTVPVARAAATDPLERLERAAALHDRGVLTDDEFAAEKTAILAAP